MLRIILASLGFLLILLVSEACKKHFHFSADITRKIAHMFSGVFAFFLPYLLTRGELIVLSVLFIGIIFGTKTFGLFGSIHGVSRKTWGEIYFPLSLGLLAYFFLPDRVLSAQFGVLVLGFSDALASIVGIEFGSHKLRIFGHQKSIEGSAAFFVTTIVITIAFLTPTSFLIIIAGLFVAFLLTSVELFSINGLDNLLLPVLGAYLFQYILLALR
ncbi:MAG: hypothetical protein PHV93_00220 [Candidatus Pacebacteria bacterium]|nr:hypothetical protein [Candidatus Paceibacterota bacterium]